MLDEGGDVLERPGHGEVGRGGAPTGHGEERAALGDSGQPKQCEQAEEEHKVEAIMLV